MASIIGKVVDNYRIVGVLGKGGMGVVYRATDLTLDRDVAIKMMDESLSRDESFLKRFQSEARALAKLQNPNIVSIFALRETELGFCIVMEYVSGKTLADEIKRGKLPLDRTISIFSQILTAFTHAHAAGIVHRDIKPSNVMLTDDDTVKVTDFGLAKIQQPSAATMTVGTGGTLYYMSPEQVRGLANVDLRGDIYSIGITLYETLCGKTPFSDDETDFGIRQAIVEGKIPSPEKLNSALPKDVVRVIQKSIEKDPAKRYQNAAEFLEALGKCQPRLDADPTPRNAPPGAADQESSSKVMTVAFSLVGLLLLVVVGYFLIPSDDGSLTLRSKPDSARVEINNQYVGLTPLSNYAMAPGDFRVRLIKQGYRSLDTTFHLEGGAELDQILTMVAVNAAKIPPGGSRQTNGQSEVDPPAIQTGSITLEAIPSAGVSAFIGEKRVSLRNRHSVEVGKSTVVFEHASYGKKSFRVDVKAGREEKIACYFEADVAIQALPVWAAVELNGVVTNSTTPTTITLPTGTHTIEAKKVGYSSQEGPVKVVVEPSAERRVHRLVFHLVKN